MFLTVRPTHVVHDVHSFPIIIMSHLVQWVVSTSSNNLFKGGYCREVFGSSLIRLLVCLSPFDYYCDKRSSHPPFEYSKKGEKITSPAPIYIYMLHMYASPHKKNPCTLCFGDVVMPRKCSKMYQDFIGDTKTCWPYP